MNKFINIIKIAGLLLFILIMNMSVDAYAASELQPPYLSFTGNYTYDSVQDQLTVSSTNVTWLTYINGESGCPYSPYACTQDDNILGASIIIGDLKNSDVNNLVFGPAPGGSTGKVSFAVKENGTAYFTGLLDNFVVTQDNGTKMKAGSITDVTVNGSAPYSRYMNEAGSNNLNLWLSFTKNAGGNDNFNTSSSGSIVGQISNTAVAPEPVSSILFITGGAILAFRRFRRRG